MTRTDSATSNTTGSEVEVVGGRANDEVPLSTRIPSRAQLEKESRRKPTAVRPSGRPWRLFPGVCHAIVVIPAGVTLVTPRVGTAQRAHPSRCCRRRRRPCSRPRTRKGRGPPLVRSLSALARPHRGKSPPSDVKDGWTPTVITRPVKAGHTQLTDWLAGWLRGCEANSFRWPPLRGTTSPLSPVGMSSLYTKK